MATPEQVIEDYFEAEEEYRQAFATACARDEFVALPVDVRQARVTIEIAEQTKRLTAARIAFETVKFDREERWIAAHEDMYGVRKLAAGR